MERDIYIYIYGEIYIYIWREIYICIYIYMCVYVSTSCPVDMYLYLYLCLYLYLYLYLEAYPLLSQCTAEGGHRHSPPFPAGVTRLFSPPHSHTDETKLCDIKMLFSKNFAICRWERSFCLRSKPRNKKPWYVKGLFGI